MNDELLERRLRRWYRAEADEQMPAPAGLRDSILDIPDEERSDLGGQLRHWTLLAAAALISIAAIAGMLVAGSEILRVRSLATPPPTFQVVPPTPSPTPTPTPPPATASPSSSASPIVVPANLLAVYHMNGETPEILTIDPATGEQVVIGTMPVARAPLGQNVFAATAGPRDAGIQWSTDRRLITISLIGDGASPQAQFDVVTKDARRIALHYEAYVSPDGRTAAVVGSDSDPSSLLLLDLTGRAVKTIDLPSDALFFSRLNWAPDSSAVILGGAEPVAPTGLAHPGPAGQVFAATETGPGYAFLVPLNGDRLLQFGGSPDVAIDVGEITEDLTRIVAGSNCQTGAPRRCSGGLLLIDIASSAITQLTRQNDDSDVHWSPDGARIAFTRYGAAVRGLWLMNADGSGVTQLTTTDESLYDHDIAWSPDGDALVFTRSPVDDEGHLGDVYIVPATGGDPQLVVSDAIADW